MQETNEQQKSKIDVDEHITSVELLFVVPVQHVVPVVRQSCPTFTMCISVNNKY
jgi:hypothetical protein